MTDELNSALYSPGVAVAVFLGVVLGVFIGMLLLVALHCARKRYAHRFFAARLTCIVRHML